MALAWAQANNGQNNAAMSALLGNKSTCSSSSIKSNEKDDTQRVDEGTPHTTTAEAKACASASKPTAAVTPKCEGYVLVMTQVLPDGLGDLIFGENAIHELLDITNVYWVRCYTSDNNSDVGEKLIAETAAKLSVNIVCTSRNDLFGALATAELEKIWTNARERYLAPWIFGLSPHEEVLLGLARKAKTQFWAMTEYGRSMGHIHTYTDGYGVMIPTGWVVDGGAGGVFRSIKRAPRTDTDWRQIMATHCGVSDASKVRLWWFYSRKDDEKKHDFSFLEGDSLSVEEVDLKIRAAAKVIPVGPDGEIALGDEKTSGEKLADQLFKVANDPTFQPTVDVACAEVSQGFAGQLSQYMWELIFNPAFTSKSKIEGAVDVIVAPNLLTQLRDKAGAQHVVAKITQLDLIHGNRKRIASLSDRRLYICSTRVPRGEMRAFLEQCEEHVYTTGDQSLAEAMFMGKLPCVKPDAKVQQWQLALIAREMGTMNKVPDLGEELRKLLTDEDARQQARKASEAHSKRVERQMCQQLGGPPSMWSPTHQVLARAGMLG